MLRILQFHHQVMYTFIYIYIYIYIYALGSKGYSNIYAWLYLFYFSPTISVKHIYNIYDIFIIDVDNEYCIQVSIYCIVYCIDIVNMYCNILT